MTKYTYYQYIKVFPKSDTAKKIYPRLFTLEFNAGKDKKAKNIITYYNKKIPKDREIQKSLATKLMDHHIDKREARKLNSWIGKLKDGFLQFSNKEINETVEILAQLVFSKIDKFERSATGKESKQKAYKTYKKLYQKKGYPRRIRAKSAYDLFRLSILTFRYDRARKWYRKIEKHFKEKEYKEYFKNFTSLAHETFLQQNRDYAMTLTLKIFSHYCQNDSIRPKGFKKEIKTTHERFFTYAITNQKSDIYLNSLKIINKCPISKIDIYRGVKRVALKALHQKKHRRFLKLAGHLQKIPRVHKKLIPHYKELYWFYHEREKTGVATRLFERLQKTAKDSQIQDIQLYRNYLKTARKRIEKLVPKFPKKFNEGQFQKEIGRVISGLEAFQKRTNDVLRTKNPHMVIKPLLYLTKAYETLGQKLREYRPKGLPKAIRKSFAKQMKGMADQFKAQSESHLRELKNSMERQQIYTLSNQGPYRRHTSKRKHLFSAELYGATYDIPRSLERRQTPVNKTAKTKRGGRP